MQVGRGVKLHVTNHAAV